MNVLGIDTATAASAACVLLSDGRCFEAEPPPERLLEGPAHAAELMPAVAGCLDQAGIGWDGLDAIAVGVGPGMFTGLRIGVATARGLATATGLELRPVGSLAALADGHGSPAPAVLALIDARRGEVFTALHQGGETAWEPFVAGPEAVAARIRDSGIAPLAVGDGAVRFRDVLEAAGATVPEDGSRAHVVRALSICRLGIGAAPVAVEALLPHYLRPPDAKPRTA